MRDLHRSIASRHRGVIRTGQVHVHQHQDGVEKPFGLAQRQMQEQSERQRGLDGNIGVDRLGTPLAGLRSGPGVDGLVTDPEGEVAAIT